MVDAMDDMLAAWVNTRICTASMKFEAPPHSHELRSLETQWLNAGSVRRQCWGVEAVAINIDETKTYFTSSDDDSKETHTAIHHLNWVLHFKIICEMSFRFFYFNWTFWCELYCSAGFALHCNWKSSKEQSINKQLLSIIIDWFFIFFNSHYLCFFDFFSIWVH